MDMPPTEEAEDAKEAKPDRHRSMTVTAVLALVVALLAVGGAVYLWFELDDVKTTSERQVGFLQSELRDLEYRVDSLESDVGDTYGLDTLSTRVDDLESDLGSPSGYESVDDRLSSLERDVEDLGFTVFVHDGQISDLTACVNDYMQTVGDAGGGRYNYYFC